MTYPTNSAALALQQIDSQLLSLRSRAQSAITKLAAGDVSSEYILNVQIDLHRSWQFLENRKSAPGISAYAQDVKGDGTLDVAAEFTAVQAAIVDARDWIENNWPEDSTWKRHFKFVDHEQSFNAFTSAQTSELRTLLTTLVNTIAE